MYVYFYGIITVSVLLLSSWLECGFNGLYRRETKINRFLAWVDHNNFLKVFESTKPTGWCLMGLLSSAYGNHNGFPYDLQLQL